MHEIINLYLHQPQEAQRKVFGSMPDSLWEPQKDQLKQCLSLQILRHGILPTKHSNIGDFLRIPFTS
jgi:hypothetical protein